MAKHEVELSQMMEEHGRLSGHQSEPTTPPEYRETTTGFPSVFSRPNRYSLSSLTSPQGMASRSNRSGSVLASPQSGIPMSRFAFDDQLPSWSHQTSRRNSDEDEKEEAVRQDPTSHRSTNAYVLDSFRRCALGSASDLAAVLFYFCLDAPHPSSHHDIFTADSRLEIRNFSDQMGWKDVESFDEVAILFFSQFPFHSEIWSKGHPLLLESHTHTSRQHCGFEKKKSQSVDQFFCRRALNYKIILPRALSILPFLVSYQIARFEFGLFSSLSKLPTP